MFGPSLLVGLQPLGEESRSPLVAAVARQLEVVPPPSTTSTNGKNVLDSGEVGVPDGMKLVVVAEKMLDRLGPGAVAVTGGGVPRHEDIGEDGGDAAELAEAEGFREEATANLPSVHDEERITAVAERVNGLWWGDEGKSC